MSLNLLAARARNNHGIATPGDPEWDSVASLLYFDGVDGSTAFSDERGLTWTPWGTAKVKASPSIIGSGAMQITSPGGGILVPNSEEFNVGASDWTAEIFVDYSAISVNPSRIFNPNSDTYDFLSLVVGPGGAVGLYISSNGTAWNVFSNGNVGTLPVGAWAHLAVCRQGGTIRFFLNGVPTVLTTTLGTTALYRNTGQRCIGGQNAGAVRYVVGSFDAWRLTNGFARYTSAFTPPTTPFPNKGPVEWGRARRYWRVLCTANDGATDGVMVQELELRAGAGRRNQANAGNANVVATASNTSSGYFAANAFDRVGTTVWYYGVSPTVASPQWVSYAAAVPINVNEIALTCTRTTDAALNREMKDFKIQSSADNVTWDDEWAVVGSTGWAIGEKRVFTRP